MPAKGGKRRFGHIEVPLKRVHLELTNKCDFNCLFCPKSKMSRPFGHMDTALAVRTISELQENGICDKITFHVMGEPTLHPDFFDILDHARDPGANVGLTTNGGGLGGQVGKRLLDYNFYQLDISLQTPDEASFRLRRAGRLGFDAYLRGILDFFAAYTATGRKTTFKFRFLNTRFRKKKMEAITGPISVISSTAELRETFGKWASRIYDILGVPDDMRRAALRRMDGLVAYKWNVVEIYPGVFFETYLLDDWGNAFHEGVRDAWAGYCFGMRDHFSILYNGDVVLCCMDFDGRTAVGNLHRESLGEVLSSDQVGAVVEGFRRFRPVHPYCKRCMGSVSAASWLLKPVGSILALKTLKPFFHAHTRLYE
jgi:MoaA/NifB/PqqE/SkfB family radical SAM enzyme